MIKKLFSDLGLSKEELDDLLSIIEADIKENRIKFGFRTSVEQLYTLALRTLCIMKRASAIDVPWSILEIKKSSYKKSQIKKSHLYSITE